MISSILKHCKNGLIYILTLPLLIVALCLFAVIGVFEFIFLGSKAIYYFFTGRNLFGDLPEDIQAKQILAELNAPKTAETVENNDQNEVQVINDYFVVHPEEQVINDYGINIEESNFEDNKEEDKL